MEQSIDAHTASCVPSCLSQGLRLDLLISLGMSNSKQPVAHLEQLPCHYNLNSWLSC